MLVTSRTVNNGVVITATLDTGILDKFQQVIDEINRSKGKRLSNLAQAVQQAGNDMLMKWGQSAEASLKSSASYKMALEQGRRYPNENDVLNYYIEQPQKTVDGKSLALLLEYGWDAFDMKEKILKGRKRVIIPFSFGSPRQKSLAKLPEAVFKLAKSRLYSLAEEHGKNMWMDSDIWSKKGVSVPLISAADLSNSVNKPVHPEKNPKNFTVLKGLNRNYAYLNMFTQSAQHPNADTIKPEWKTGKYTGLRAIKTQSGKQTAIHSFQTYRTISKNSAVDSWINPGSPARLIFKYALERHSPVIRPLLERGLALDIEDLKQAFS